MRKRTIGLACLVILLAGCGFQQKLTTRMKLPDYAKTQRAAAVAVVADDGASELREWRIQFLDAAGPEWNPAGSTRLTTADVVKELARWFKKSFARVEVRQADDDFTGFQYAVFVSASAVDYEFAQPEKNRAARWPHVTLRYRFFTVDEIGGLSAEPWQDVELANPSHASAFHAGRMEKPVPGRYDFDADVVRTLLFSPAYKDLLDKADKRGS